MEHSLTDSARPHSAEYFGEQRDYWWNSDFLQLVARRLDFASISSVLDIGCGVGHWGRALSPVLPTDARLIGIDREPEWVQGATARAAAAGLASRFSYRQGDCTSLPFADNTFDLVTCQTVLIHVADPRAVLAEMLRVTKPGGLVLAVEPNNLANGVIASSVHAALSTDELVDLYRFQLTCERGKQNLGLGFNSVGPLVPGMLASLGAADVQVCIPDRAAAMFPPYAGPAQQAELEQTLDWAQRDFWIWDQHETMSYYLAGNGDPARFEPLWALAMSVNRTTAAAIRAGTYHSAGGSMSFIISGRKPAASL
jgi:SAM-dependent methyltransferase